MALSTDILACLAIYVRFLALAVPSLLLVRQMLRPPHEVFRKMLHAVAFSSAPIVVRASSSWQVSAIVLVVFGAAVWPILAAGERISGFAELFVQRRTHEVRRSMLLLFWGDAAIVAWCWGACARPDVAVAAILMWGFGDAAAALVGKRFGRHRVSLPLADHKKTWEGSAGMFATSAVVGALAGVPLPAVMAAAAVGAYVELVTHGGYDTVTVPVAVAVVLFVLT